jgi:hypothetical protein
MCEEITEAHAATRRRGNERARPLWVGLGRDFEFAVGPGYQPRWLWKPAEKDS